ILASLAIQGIQLPPESAVTPQLIFLSGWPKTGGEIMLTRKASEATRKVRAIAFMVIPPRACCLTPPFLFLTVELFEESALVQFSDEARIDELIRLVLENFRAALRDVFVGRLESLRDRIGHRDEIFLINLVGTLEQLAIVGAQILGENLEARFLLGLEKMDSLHVRPDHPRHGVAILLNCPFARHNRHGR